MTNFSDDLIDHMIEDIESDNAWLNDTHLDFVNTTSLFDDALSLQYHIAINKNSDYMIVSEVIFQDQAQRIAKDIHEELQSIKLFDNWFVYQVTSLAHEMIFNFIKIWSLSV